MNLEQGKSLSGSGSWFHYNIKHEKFSHLSLIHYKSEQL